ncbi:Cytosolic endo-beta-N-acetylglucosaminidase [Anabarilius grahami]|uniref:Cytosolic endo-beta-N-acetylglucosaminidase n=1 Tax=Anabarilius grahami TaxID=495550 RepID=A0A3N0YCU4_ANAGA|nr:Cytosolic endo-beta-N-acetylglucosaminidase [Anabarilius grahami]
MAENNEPVSFTTLAIVMKHIDPNMKLSEAQIWASELHKCISDMQNRKYSSLLEFSDEEALGCGLSCPGTAKEKIQAVIDYRKSHPLPSHSYLSDSDCTSPYRIVNELLEAIKGKYMFCAQGVNSRKEYYAMQLKKAVTIRGVFYEVDGDFRVSEDPALLKEFQKGKINGQCYTEFQGTPKYCWSRDGKPPAHPLFIVAQLYWSNSPRNLNYQLEEVTDKEALTLLYDEMPALEEKGKTDPTFKTYTWFLNKPSNAVTDFPELKDYSEGQTFSEDYLCPSTEPLKTEGFSYEWSREVHETSHKDFTLIYRARPTLERVPQVITEENRIRFDYWQYIKEFVVFGGSHREGTVLAPDPTWIDQAHRNGVGIFGTVFLPPLEFGGNVNDIEELAKPENLQKLVDIAHRLNFEGWFLNVESFENYNEPRLKTLKHTIKEMDLRGKEIIWYLPDKSDDFDPKSKGVKMTCDEKINNAAPAFKEEKEKLYLDFSQLIELFFFDQAPRNYHMFVDEPFWKNTLKQTRYLVDPVRFRHAQNCLWQFFLGENGLERKPTGPWYGIAKYAKQRI